MRRNSDARGNVFTEHQRISALAYSNIVKHRPAFNMMLGKRKAIQAITAPRKKRKPASAIEEISFDFSAREEYLTGFHKRKLQRIKHAKEEAAKKEREDKLAARKIVRFNSSTVCL